MNLRNDIAHGLFDDTAAWSYDAIYAWWFCLRLVHALADDGGIGRCG